MDYNLAIFKAITLIRQQSPEIFITLDITDIEAVAEPDHDGQPYAYAFFNPEVSRYGVKVSHWTIENLDPFNLAALLRHELGHILYGDVLINPDEYENPYLLNIAEDAYINSEIPLFKEYKNCVELGTPVLLEHISPRFNTRQNTSHDVYNYLYKLFKDNKLPVAVAILMQKLEEQNGNSNDGNSGKESSEKGSESSEESSGEEGSESSEEGSESSEEGSQKSGKKGSKESSEKGKESLSSIGSHKNHGKKKKEGSDSDPSSSESSNSNKPLSEVEKSIAESMLNNLIDENMEKFMGMNSANINRMIENMKKAEYDFKKLFAMAVHRSLYAGKRSTWLKPNRRLKNKAKGYKPTPKPKVLLLTDTSGSISQETIEIINWQVDYLSKEFDFDVCWGDTQLDGFEHVKRGDKKNIKFVGGGGTNLNFFVELEKKHKYDLIVFNTDGYIPKIIETPSQKIFCIYERGKEVSGYLNIKINPFTQENF